MEYIHYCGECGRWVHVSLPGRLCPVGHAVTSGPMLPGEGFCLTCGEHVPIDLDSGGCVNGHSREAMFEADPDRRGDGLYGYTSRGWAHYGHPWEQTTTDRWGTTQPQGYIQRREDRTFIAVPRGEARSEADKTQQWIDERAQREGRPTTGQAQNRRIAVWAVAMVLGLVAGWIAAPFTLELTPLVTVGVIAAVGWVGEAAIRS